MSINELIIDTIEPEDKDCMYIHPSRISTAKYLSPNIFDKVSIRHSTVDQIATSGLSFIYSCLKPEGKINIIVHQPISIMVFYDSKQIDANLKLAGFENVIITDIEYPDEKLRNIQTQEIEAEKPKSQRNYDVHIEIQKTTYNEKKPIENNNYNNYNNISNENKYKSKTNKTYVNKEIKEIKEIKKEIIVEDKKDEVKETGRYKNRSYIRGQKDSNNQNEDNNNSMEEKKRYIQRRYRASGKNN